MDNAPPQRRCTPGFDVGDRPPSPPVVRAGKPDDCVVLRGHRILLTSDVGVQFVVDCARNREKIFSDARLQEKYSIDPNAWNDIVKNQPLRLAIAAEAERRMLNGTAAQEKAAQIFTEAPEVLGSILRDNKASPRHRIEASKELRTSSRSDNEKPGADTERIIVTINIGNGPEDKLVYDCGPLKPKQDTTDDENDQW